MVAKTDKESRTEQDSPPKVEPHSEESPVESEYNEEYPWSQWDTYGETDLAYGAFKLYLELPPDQRSVSAAFRCTELYKSALSEGKEKQTNGSWKNWSKKFQWASRARAYDDHHSRIKAYLAIKDSLSLAEREIARGEKLCKVGEDIFSIMDSDWSNIDDDDKLDFMLQLSRLAKGPLDIIKLGSELEAKGYQRKIDAMASLAPQLNPFDSLNEKERKTLDEALEQLLQKGKEGHVQALTVLVNSFLGKG